MRFREFSCLVVSVFVGLTLHSDGEGPVQALLSYIEAAHFRIADGREASIEEFPYQVSIEVQGRQWCGGSIIAPKFVLTAAHCVKWVEGVTPIATYDLLVRVGSDVSCTGGTVHQVEKVIPHEKFNELATVDKFDIAVMKMVQPFRYSDRVRPIRLATEAPEEGQKAWVTGFGKQEITRSQSTKERHLMAVELPILSLASCRAYLNGVAEDMICAGYQLGHRDPCQGDSGGPLAVRDVLAGVVAWGKGCGLEGYPALYTNVARYYDWIIHKIITT